LEVKIKGKPLTSKALSKLAKITPDDVKKAIQECDRSLKLFINAKTRS
jgi:hypothetical protein